MKFDIWNFLKEVRVSSKFLLFIIFLLLLYFNDNKYLIILNSYRIVKFSWVQLDLTSRINILLCINTLNMMKLWLVMFEYLVWKIFAILIKIYIYYYFRYYSFISDIYIKSNIKNIIIMISLINLKLNSLEKI